MMNELTMLNNAIHCNIAIKFGKNLGIYLLGIYSTGQELDTLVTYIQIQTKNEIPH